MIVDSMYNATKTSPSDWQGFSLATVRKVFDLPEKVNPDKMDIDPKNNYDHASMLRYNCRDADLHAWLAKRMLLCKRTCRLAGVAHTTIWDSIANSTGVMVFCLIQSVALSKAADARPGQEYVYD